MTQELKKEIREELKENPYQEFFQYLGIDPRDFEGFYDSIDFDDCSH